MTGMTPAVLPAMTTQPNNGYRYAELARGESLCSPDTCDHCERTNLKKTVKLISPEGRVVWFGVGCAANAMGVGLKEVRAGKAKAESDLAQREREARHAWDQEEDAVWQTFLDQYAPAQKGNRFKQIEAIAGGSDGWRVVREKFQAEHGEWLAAHAARRPA